jgi:hypothetical protein
MHVLVHIYVRKEKMKRKMVVLIALAIAFLSVSAVSAYAAVKDATQKKIYVNKSLYMNGVLVGQFEGWVPVREDGSYSVPLFTEEGYFSGIEIYYSNSSDTLGELIYVERNDMLTLSDFDAKTGSCVSAISGLAGIGCLATVIVKRRKGVW